MKNALRSGITTALAAAALTFMSADAVLAQGGSTPSTLRYGSGLFDIPVASVAPHMSIYGTYSGFQVDGINRTLTDASGRAVATGGAVSRWMSDASVGIGLYDRVEVGATLQSFSDSNTGGTMVGGYGRVAIFNPAEGGIGLAVGARFVSEPSYDGQPGSANYQPSRLGFPDVRLVENYTGGADDVSTAFTPYIVSTARFAGPTTEGFLDYDVLFTLGWGHGMFNQGEDLGIYSFVNSGGWFFGSDLAFELAPGTLLHVMGEYNGFDVNAGLQADIKGVSIGGYVLGLNYSNDLTEYRSKKFGIMASVALCPSSGGLCAPGLVERVKPDTIQLPAPPADTVIVEREVAPPLPTGTPTTICLATGESMEVMVTAQGDTLVGSRRVSIRTLRPGVVFAGTYAGNEGWFTADDAIRMDDRDYQKSGGEIRLDCRNIMRVGEHEGVPLFADSGNDRPFQTIYVPVRPGVWQAYQTGLRRTRG